LAENDGAALADRIAEKTLPMIRDMGYDLADIELVKEGANRYLRFFIEHLDPAIPVNTDDCQAVSEKLSDWLDEADPIPQAYFLEVSSPGLERRIRSEKDFTRFQGHMTQVSTYAPLNGEKLHLGLLGPVSPEEVILRRKDGDISIPREKISVIRLYWNEQEEG